MSATRSSFRFPVRWRFTPCEIAYERYTVPGLPFGGVGASGSMSLALLRQFSVLIFCGPRRGLPHWEILVRPFHASTFNLGHAKLVRPRSGPHFKLAKRYSCRMELPLASRYPPFSDKKSKMMESALSPSFPPRDSVYKPRGWRKKWVVIFLALGASLLWARRKKLLAF